MTAAIVAALEAEHANRCTSRRCTRCDATFALVSQVEQLGYAAGPRALAALIGPTHPAAVAAIPRQRTVRGAVAA